MKKSKKVVCILIVAIILSMFAFKTTVYADIVAPGPSHSKAKASTNYDSETLIKIIIVLISIILVMSIIILKYIYNKYRLEIKLVKKDVQASAQGSVGAQADFTETQEFKDELGKNVMEETKRVENDSNNDNIQLKLDMTKLFAVMILIVGIIIIVSVVS